MRRALLLPFLLVLALVGGCGPADQQVGGAPREKNYKKIVSLSPGTTELLSTVNAMSYGRIVGRTQADNYPMGVTKIPVVASVKPDYEKLAQIRPDLVVYDASLYNDADVQKIKQLGADTFVINANNLKDFETQIYSLSELVGGETNAADYVDKIVAAESGASTTAIRPKVAIIMPEPGGQHLIAGTDSLLADVVKAAGGELVGPKSTLFVPIDAEMILSLNPDWIVTAGKPDDLLADTRLRSLKALTSKQVIPIQQDVVLRRGSRVDQLITAIHSKIAK